MPQQRQVYHAVIAPDMSGEQQKRILIVDDDPDITITLRMSLEDNGFKADSYTDPVLAFENFHSP